MDEKAALQAWLVDTSAFQDQLPEDVQLETKLDDGGQGIVFNGNYKGTPAAIKLYYPGQITKRIEREVRALQSIQSTHIVPLLWSGKIEYEDRQLPVVATEYVSGVSLDKRISAGPFVESDVGRLIHNVAISISALWEKRIVHRDLKPENIIERTNQSYCVIDLGVARHLEEVSITAMGSTWGTVGYMSPEQMRAARQLTCKSDIFALGIIALEAALGKHPTNRDQHRIISRRLHEGLPNEVEKLSFASLLKKMLAPRPVQRPAPEALIRELSAYNK